MFKFEISTIPKLLKYFNKFEVSYFG